MDGMANFNISADEEEMLLGMEGMESEENTNLISIGPSINTTEDPRNYSLSGNFVIESEYHHIIMNEL